MCLFADLKQIAEKYIQKMSIWEMGLLKFLLCSLGILIGTGITRPHNKKVAQIFCCLVFALSWSYIVGTFVVHCIAEVGSLTRCYKKDF